jgi:tetratricopeptide (TPR) repeat protein
MGPALVATLLMIMPGGGQADDVQLCQDKDTSVSIPACTRLIDDGTQSADTLGSLHSLRGIAYFNAGDYARAIPDFTDAIPTTDPGEPLRDIKRLRAMSYLSNGDLDKAIADYTATLNPPDAVGLGDRAFVYLKAKKYRAAIRDYDAALALQPGIAQALYGRGVAERAIGLTAEAARDLAAGTKANPAVVQAFAGEGLAPAP